MLMTTQEVADKLKVDIETVRRLVQKGKLKAYKIGNAWRISDDDLNSFIKERSNQ